MTAVRPPVFPPQRPPTAQPQRTDPARLAAQKAFFEAALGNTAAPVAASAPAPAAQPASPAARLPDPVAEKSARILRPGSLLDIRV